MTLGRTAFLGSGPTGVALALLALLALACEGNHDALALEPDGGGGTAGAGGSEGGGGASAEGGSSDGGTGVGGGPIEPEGSLQITVANGVADQAATMLCFVPYPGSGQSVQPWPDGGLPFGRAQTVADATDLAPPGIDIHVHVIAGDLGAASGSSCEALITSPPPGVSVAPLALVPSAVFEADKSLLLVPAGCMGGDGHEDAQQEQACGVGYSVDAPNPTLVAVSMSRISSPDRVGFQVVQASTAANVFDVYVTPGIPSATNALLAPLLTFGAILPYPPFQGYTAADLGAVGDVELVTFPENDATPTTEIALGDVLTDSGLSTEDVAGGQGHVLVAVGAAPGAPSGSWWHDFRYVLIPVQP